MPKPYVPLAETCRGTCGHVDTKFQLVGKNFPQCHDPIIRNLVVTCTETMTEPVVGVITCAEMHRGQIVVPNTPHERYATGHEQDRYRLRQGYDMCPHDSMQQCRKVSWRVGNPQETRWKPCMACRNLVGDISAPKIVSMRNTNVYG